MSTKDPDIGETVLFGIGGILILFMLGLLINLLFIDPYTFIFISTIVVGVYPLGLIIRKLLVKQGYINE